VDIAHNADPSQRDTNNSGVPDTFPTPDSDTVPSADFENQPVETYDDELLKLALEGRDGRFVCRPVPTGSRSSRPT
jgi:hypothetical protein